MRLGVSAAVVEGTLVVGDLDVVDGAVAAVGLSAKGGGTAFPGFVDIHTHGFNGIDFALATTEEMGAASMALTATGVTGFQPTLLSLQESDLVAALERHAGASYAGARFLGSHIEGPFLSPVHPGAHDPNRLMNPDRDLLERLLAAGSVRQMTLAPELPGAEELIEVLQASGVVVALGHSDASAEIAHRAFDAGARVLTHVFNASRPFSHRDPGIVGVALTRDDVFVTAVVDNVHLSREATLLAMGVGPGRFVVVTDAMAAAGVGDGVYTLGNRDVTVQGGEARLDDGTIASSVLTMDAALRNLVDLGWNLAQASSALATSPAAAIGRDDLGKLQVGGRADLVVVDDNLRVESTWVGGVEKYHR